MALPPPNHACWQKLANGGMTRLKTQQLGIQLMTKRLERSTEPASTKAAEIHAFFVKWERTLTNEIPQLSTI